MGFLILNSYKIIIYIEVIKMKDDNCIFCKLANGDIPTNSIYEDDDFKVILDASPATKGHALILPKQALCKYF